MKLSIEQTRTGFVVRPEGAVGSIGWSPKPWSAQYFSSRSKAQQYINQVALAVAINEDRRLA
jgi:hypothetical protein